MIDEPGSFSGRLSSPSPQRGPEPSQRMSLAIFISEQASVLSAPLRHHERVVSGERGELVGRRNERQPGQRGDSLRGPLGELAMGVQPGADRGAADRELVDIGQAPPSMRLEIGIELRDVAGEFLAQRERHRVHQMRAPDLDDVGEFRRLGRQRVAQLARRRE